MSAQPTPRPNPELVDRLAEIDRLEGLRAAAAAAAAKPKPISHVDCRTFGHSWTSIEANRNPAVGWYMRLECERCHTVRNDIVNRYGVVEARHYKYEPDYKDPDKWGRSQWRMQYLRQLNGS
jgi:hypothetical protein